MTYRELLSDIIRYGDLDQEAYIVEWTRDQHGAVKSHKTHIPVARFSMLSHELIIESNDWKVKSHDKERTRDL